MAFPPSKDWTYYSEGGKHAVFCYQQDNTRNNENIWIGMLLRIDKVAFRYCDYVSVNTETKSTGEPIVNSISSDHDPFRAMMYSILQPYVDAPRIVSLNFSYMCSLRTKALATDQIPTRRRNDWYSKINEKEFYECADLKVIYTGNLLRDYRFSNKSLSSCVSLCMEIKPKCGFLTRSPFVDDCATTKYQKSRYLLLQELMRSGKVTKDWMYNTSDAASGSNSNCSIVFESSKYDPLDLFSGNKLLIRKALYNLIHCSQNNVRIWQNHNLLLGLGSNALKSSLNRKNLAKTTESDEHNMIDFLVKVTEVVLTEEEFLVKVLNLQKLDILDTDGAMQVYDRLIYLCDGNEQLAESLVDSTVKWISDDRPSYEISSLLKHCPVRPPQEFTFLSSFCDDIEAAAALFNGNNGMLPPMDKMKDIRMRAQSKIYTLSANECCYLLQIYLLSLTVCDLTFFINFVFPKFDAENNSASPDIQESLSLQLHSKQSNGAPGRISYQNGTHGFGTIYYELKAIDVDKKPAEKLRSRQIKEQLFHTSSGDDIK